MRIQPFNADGVTAKLLELQHLPDDQLRHITDQMRMDFRAWLMTNFSLNDDQYSYLQGMDTRFLQVLAVDVADCMDFRLPFFVTFFPKDPIGSKFIMPKSELIRIAKPPEGYEVTGMFRIEIGYNNR